MATGTTVTYKVPSQGATGGDTFSDAIVGLQITNGTNQLTNANFELDRVIPEKDSKYFRSEPFSDFLTLDDIKEETFTPANGTTSSNNDSKIRYKNSKNNGSISIFGSLKERLNVAVTNIIKNYPAAVYVDNTSPVRSTDYSAYNIEYDQVTDTTTFDVDYSLFFNPFDILFIKPSSSILPESINSVRDFFSSYTKYVIDLNNVTYEILNYEEPTTPYLVANFRVKGNCFDGLTGSTTPFLIRPTNGYVEEFFNSLDELESILLNRDTTPKYTSSFVTITDDNKPDLSFATWPTTYDNWNISTVGFNFSSYIEKLKVIGENVDNYKSNLVIRFLTSPQLLEFDTEDKKMESILQIYGQSFDKVKRYIDNIQYMRNVTYDGINNVPETLLKNLAENLGLSTIKLFDETTLSDVLYNRNDSTYDGISTGLNLSESENEVYRRLLNNLAYLYKSKGTRKTIEFLLKFIGAPEQMILIDEYVYKVNGSLPTTTLEDDISEAISIGKNTHVGTITSLSGTTYSATTINTYSPLYRYEYPVDVETGLPSKYETSDGSVFFQIGAGWNKLTLDHRSSDILDTEHSDLTSKIKTIITKPKPFTYGEEYFDNFRKLPGLNYGYDLISEVDNKKTKNITSNFESKLTLNRKNINIFLSSDNIINYDIYRKMLTNNFISFNYIFTSGGYTLETLNNELFLFLPDDTINDYEIISKLSFEDFSEVIKNIFVYNSNNVRYYKSYNMLSQVFTEYNNSNSFIPYTREKVNSYINKITPYWVDIVEQFIPATTLWNGGNLIQNTVFERTKYQHKRNRYLPYNNENLIYYVDTTEIECLTNAESVFLRNMVDFGGYLYQNTSIYDSSNVSWACINEGNYSYGETNNNVIFNTPNNRTYSFWYKPSHINGNNQILFSISSYGMFGGNGEFVVTSSNDNRVRVTFYGTSVENYFYEPTVNLKINEWNLITVVLDQTSGYATFKTYVNSEYNSKTDVYGAGYTNRRTVVLTNNSIGIGYSNYLYGVQPHVKGAKMNFASFYIWDGILTPEEIIEFYNETKNKFILGTELPLYPYGFYNDGLIGTI